MMYALAIEDAAVEDAAGIYTWYEEQKEGLGLAFLMALDDCYAFLQRSPLGWQLRKGIYRHARIDGFPNHRVVFAVDGDRMTVYQVRHTSRRPSKKFGP